MASPFRLTFLVARRYFFSRKQRTVINIISWISLPLIVQPAKGKTLHADSLPDLMQIPGIKAVSQIVEDEAWLTYRQNEAIVTLRGVDTAYTLVTGLDTLLYEGIYLLHDPSPDTLTPTAHRLILGAEVYYGLGIRPISNTPVAVRIPRRGKALGTTVDQAFNTAYALPTANFYIQQDIDNRYVVADIDFVRSLLDYTPDQCTALAIALQPHADPRRVKATVATLLNPADTAPRYTVRDRFEQQPLYYKVFRSERLGIYLILALIVFIATLNLMASITLLVIDKRHDTGTLRSLGMTPVHIRRIFLTEGVLIATVGIVVGMIVGFVLCYLQQCFGIIRMGDNFVVSAFPVAMRAVDFLYTFLLVATLSTLAILVAVRRGVTHPAA